jgi:hypothetical protein
VRQAKAAFTTQFVAPPWQSAPKETVSPQLSQIRQLASFIDKPDPTRRLPADVLSAFTAYKALERLRVLAEAGSKSTAADRTQLEAQFAKGLGELRSWLAVAPSDQLQLAFGQPSPRAESVSVLPNRQLQGDGIAASRDAPIPGLTGNEVFELKLAKAGMADTVRIDLALGLQPPTINSVITAFNMGIAAIPQRNPDGVIVKDEAGNPVPRWLIRMTADKSTGEWRLTVVPAPTESIAINEPSTATAIMVATGITAMDRPTAVRLMRIDNPLTDPTRTTLATISAKDGQANRIAESLPPARKIGGVTPLTPDKRAETSARAVVTDGDGNSYVLGATAGDLGANLSDGRDEIFLTKFDSLGRMVWQNSMGLPGESNAAAMSLALDGSIVVAGTVSGRPGDPSADSDMVIARFASDGNELMNITLPGAGLETATALTLGQNGSIFLAGNVAGRDATIVQLGANGSVTNRFELAGISNVASLVADGNEGLLVLGAGAGKASLIRVGQDLGENGRIDLGAVKPTAMTRAADGGIWITGNTTGTETADGAVFRVAPSLENLSKTTVSSDGNDSLDSIVFADNTVFVGGRTTGSFGESRTGDTDGFLARINAETGQIDQIVQFGQPTIRTEPVRLAITRAPGSGMAALGLPSGDIQAAGSSLLTALTSLRAGDEFKIKVGERPAQTISIQADDTLNTLSARIRRKTGTAITVAVASDPKDGGGRLRLTAQQGLPTQLLAGPTGRDALAKLGLEPQRLAQPREIAAGSPSVRPGGAFGLALSMDLSVATRSKASVAFERIKGAIAATQTGFRSLYWNDTKAQLVDANSQSKTSGNARQQAQLQNYTAALNRLSGRVTTSSF